MTDDLSATDAGDPTNDEPATNELVPAEPTGSSPLPFEGLVAPEPIDASPPEPARWLAFGGILLGGLLGGLIGYGVGDLLGDTSVWAATGGLIGGVFGAVGVGIIAALTLRAMNEWNAVHHPEAES